MRGPPGGSVERSSATRAGSSGTDNTGCPMNFARMPRSRNQRSSNGSRHKRTSETAFSFVMRHGAHAQSCGATRLMMRAPVGFNRALSGKFALGESTGTCTATRRDAAQPTISSCNFLTWRIRPIPASPITPSSAVRPSMVAPAASIFGPPHATGSRSG